MKKLFTLITLLAVSAAVLARPVDRQRAQQWVETHFFAPAVCLSPAEWDEIYVFAPVDGQGFVVMSADDCTRPLLGYSMSAQWPAATDRMPVHVTSWIDGYRREIAELRKAGAIPAAAVQAQWAQPKSGNLAGVEPLMTTTWNQSPRYNAMCPYSAADSARAVTGCVATAQAQIMKYWNHPAKGHGRHFYDHELFGTLGAVFDTLYQWDSMPDALGWGSTDAEIHAVAQLMYHVGVSVEMNYGVHSSGAHVIAYGMYNMPSSERSLRDHFRYSPMLYSVAKQNYMDSDWDSLMRNEIVHGRPVLYSGRDASGGHAFVLDGYDSLGMFHVNWGWGGWYDGYYTTDSLSPGAGGIGGNATYTFNQDNAAVIGIRPSYGNDTIAEVNVVSIDTTMGTVIGSGTYIPYVDTLFAKASGAEGYRFAGWKSGNVTNPLRFVLNGDFSDTALFVPVGRDTLAYCNDRYYTAWRDDYSNVTEWGIRVPASRRNPLRALTSVQLFVAVEGYYTMTVYYGDSICPETRIYGQLFNLTDGYGWTNLELDSALALVGDKDLWITFRFTTGVAFPAASSYYTGVSDGTWYRLPEGWVPFDEHGVYQTWMIRAVFSERPCRVTLLSDGYVDASCLIGGGDFAVGQSAVVSVDSSASCMAPFDYWELGGERHNQPSLSFVVTQDTVVTAHGHCIGIGTVEPEPLSVQVTGRTIAVEGVETARLYAVDGRLLATGRRFTAPAAGIYLLKVGEGVIRKIVIL